MNVFNKLADRYADPYEELVVWVNKNVETTNEEGYKVKLLPSNLTDKEALRLKAIIKRLFLDRGNMEEVRAVWVGLTTDECFADWYARGKHREAKCNYYSNCRNCEIDTMIECL